MHRWVQVSEDVAKKLEEEGNIPNSSGYYYTDAIAKEKMVVFHVDASEKLLLLGTTYSDLSVRFLAGHKPLISCVYNIARKDDEMGVIISAFQSREFGFGVVDSEKQLKEINERQQGKKYKELKAAIEAKGNKDGFKKTLTSSPFDQTFEYGADGNGYWNCKHMALQLEDYIDVIMHLYPEYDYLFLFDHYGLNVKK
jgi:hypothetical protein